MGTGGALGQRLPEPGKRGAQVGRPERGGIILHRAIALSERLIDQEGRRDLARELAVAYVNKGLAVKQQGDSAGAAELYDREVDFWSAAARLYLLTGFTPRDFPEEADPWPIVLNTQAVPIRLRDPTVPGRLAEVIDHALIDSPAISFKTAGELRRAIEATM